MFGMSGRRTLIPKSIRRSVGNQYLGVFGNHIPVSLNVPSSFDVKSPVVEFGLNRRPPESQTHDFCTRVFKISCVGQQTSGKVWLFLKQNVMIPGNDNFV